MSDVTDADREKARQLTSGAWSFQVTGQFDLARDAIAAALAEEREKARAPFLALADEWAAIEAYAEAEGYVAADHGHAAAIRRAAGAAAE